MISSASGDLPRSALDTLSSWPESRCLTCCSHNATSSIAAPLHAMVRNYRHFSKYAEAASRRHSLIRWRREVQIKDRTQQAQSTTLRGRQRRDYERPRYSSPTSSNTIPLLDTPEASMQFQITRRQEGRNQLRLTPPP